MPNIFIIIFNVLQKDLSLSVHKSDSLLLNNCFSGNSYYLVSKKTFLEKSQEQILINTFDFHNSSSLL